MMVFLVLALRRYADFSGRSRRKEHWIFLLGVFAVWSVLIGLLAWTDPGASGRELNGLDLALLLGLTVFSLVMLVPTLALQVRRFHDQDRSGWMILLNFISYLGSLIVLAFMCIEGTRGENRFGPDPKRTEGNSSAATRPDTDSDCGLAEPRFFEDIKLGEGLFHGGLVVDSAEAAEFACRYDAGHAPEARVHYSGGGPPISPWLVAALSWKMLDDIVAANPVQDAVFSQPSELKWEHSVSPGDVLRLEVEVTELLPPHPLFRTHGWVRVKVILFATGSRGPGTYYEDEGELEENMALTYLAQLKALRRQEVPLYDSFTGKLIGF